MSNYSGPNILKDGLIFYYDRGNTSKSWKGEPTTNLTPNMGLSGVSGITVTFVGTEDDGWKKYSLSGTWNSGTYPYSVSVSGATFVGGQVYSTGCYIKTNVPQKFGTLFTGMQYVNEPKTLGGSSFSIPQFDGSIFVGQTNFAYTNTTSQIGYLNSRPLENGIVFSPSTDFVWIKNGQIEAKAYLTPFVAGTRSNTQAVVDLTTNNTITANSLTYASNNTFSFNGTTDSMSISGTASTFFTDFSSGQLTLDVWINIPAGATWSNGSFGNILSRGSFSGSHGLVRTTTNNQVAAYFRQSGTTFAAIQSSATIQRDTWTNLVATWTGNTLSLYVNGELASANSGTLGTPTVTDWVIGPAVAFSGSSGNRLQGQVSATKIYDRALSAIEVAQNFNVQRPIFGI
jgi:hypothetical protein